MSFIDLCMLSACMVITCSASLGLEGFSIVYHFDNNICVRKNGREGLPLYVVHSIEQTIRVHGGEVNIVLLTNAMECNVKTVHPSTFTTSQEIELLSKVMVVDTRALKLESEKAMKAESMLQVTLFDHIFNKSNPANSDDADGHLYLTSLARFIHLEGLMTVSKKGSLKCVDGRTVPPLQELLLVESDNLLFADITAMLPRIRESYFHLAGVIQSNMNLVGSVLYVANEMAITKFNTFVSDMAHNATKFEEFTTYCAYHQNRKRVPGGLPPYDHRGWGLPRYAVNEMSILLYYHRVCLESTDEQQPPVRCLESFPLFGRHQGLVANTKHADFIGHVGYNSKTNSQLPPDIASHPRQVGNATYDAAWDPGSWGQFLAGTYMLKRQPGFIDLVHIPGKAIVKSACQVRILCSCTEGRDPAPKDYSGAGNRVEGDLLPVSDKFLHDDFTRQPINVSTKTLYPIRRGGTYGRASKRLAVVNYQSPPSPSAADNRDVYYTAPFIACCANVGGKAPVVGVSTGRGPDEDGMEEVGFGSHTACGPWQPLVNLHMHSKNALPFMSKACVC